MTDLALKSPKIDKKLYIIIGVSLLTVYICLYIIINCPTEDISFNSEPVVKWNENWNVTFQDGSIKAISLPFVLPENSKEIVTITKSLPEKDAEEMSICMRAPFQKIIAYVDGKIIYKYGFDNNKYPKKNIGAAWALFRLPNDCEGKELRLDIYSQCDRYLYDINDVYMGDKSAVLFSIFHEYSFNLIMVMILFTSAIIMFILHFFTNTGFDRDYSLIYLSLFSILSGIWILGESKTLQFFIGNQFLIYNIAFFAFFLFPLPMTVYIDTCYKRHHPRFANILFYLFLANFTICIILGMTGICNFVSMILPSQVLMTISILITLVSLFYESVKFKNKEAFEILVGFGIFSFFGLCDLYLSIKKNYSNVSKFTAIGLLLFVIYTLTLTLAKIYKINKAGTESYYYKCLAYIDPLTKGNNRTAFTHDVDKYFSESESTWLFIFDLNNLKRINDCAGHNMGDDAIKRVFSSISDSFAPKGTAYRMGGDEFAVILPQSSKDEVENMIELLRKRIDEENSKVEYLLSVACGYEMYDKERFRKFDDFFSCVDNIMYKNKREYKMSKMESGDGSEKI